MTCILKLREWKQLGESIVAPAPECPFLPLLSHTLPTLASPSHVLTAGNTGEENCVLGPCVCGRVEGRMGQTCHANAKTDLPIWNVRKVMPKIWLKIQIRNALLQPRQDCHSGLSLLTFPKDCWCVLKTFLHLHIMWPGNTQVVTCHHHRTPPPGLWQGPVLCTDLSLWWNERRTNLRK